MLNHILLIFSCYICGVLSGMLGPCKKTDQECLQKTINDVLPQVFAGIPSRGLDTLDPSNEKLIEGNLSVLKYKFINTTTTGYKSCAVKNTKFELDKLKLYFEMDCPNIDMIGDYEMTGKLIAMPVEGKGTYRITSGKYLISINAGLKIIEGNDGKTYLNIKNFETKAKPLEPIKFEFNNLFNGQKDLSDAVHKFAHENYLEVAELFQDPVFNAGVKAISKNINKFLKTEPIQEIFVD